jgi:hypothetical protein
VTKSQYIAALTASPWGFPRVDGAADVPGEWAAAAWDVQAIRAPIVDELIRDVSKVGQLCLDEKQLVKMSEVLRTDQVIALYEALCKNSPHRESEFRDDFQRFVAKHAHQLPPALTREQIIELLGVDEATADELLGDEDDRDS